MKEFFKTLFASTLGVIIGVSLLGFISFMIFIAVLSASSSSTYNLQDKTVLMLDLSGSLNDRENSSPFSALFGESEVGLDDMVDAIRKAKENDEIKGIYIKAGAFNSGIASLEPIRKAILDFKQSGKFVVAYGDYYLQSTYYIASAADKVIMNPSGTFDFHGLSATPMFVRGLYEKLGVTFQVFKVGTFKSAVEPLIQDKMSEPNRLQVSSYLNDIWNNLLTGISESRGISIETLNRYADQCLTFSEADSIVIYNLVDTLMYSTDVNEYLKELTKTEEKKNLRLATVKNMTTVGWKQKNTSKDRIAILYAEGSIIDDDATNSPFSSEPVITAKQYVKELQKLKDDENVKAVVFRVNSGGGSAYASEQIWNAVAELKEKKPIVVSMGDYAASGGYYISCAANTIVAEPMTLTGSIGIFGVLPEGEELAKKMGVSFDEVKTNKHGTFGGVPFGIPFIVSAYSRRMNEEETNMLQKYIERGYDLFITRCADGRSMTKAEIDSVGQGRVWTGNQALQLGLVDKLGSIEEAVKVAAELADIESYKISKYPAKKDFFTQLLEESMGNSKLKFIKTLAGKEEFEQQIVRENLKSFDIRRAEISERVSF